jgi:hypothetical protein
MSSLERRASTEESQASISEDSKRLHVLLVEEGWPNIGWNNLMSGQTRAGHQEKADLFSHRNQQTT